MYAVLAFPRRACREGDGTVPSGIFLVELWNTPCGKGPLGIRPRATLSTTVLCRERKRERERQIFWDSRQRKRELNDGAEIPILLDQFGYWSFFGRPPLVRVQSPKPKVKNRYVVVVGEKERT